MPNDRPRRPSTPRGGSAPRGTGARGGAPRSGGQRSGSGPRAGAAPRSGGPRRDGGAGRPPREGGAKTSFTNYGDRPSGPRAAGPRREGTGPRRDGDAPRSRAPRRDDGRAPRRDDSAAGRPPRERSERKPYGERTERKPYGERSERKPYGDRSERKPYGERSGRPSGPRTTGPRREGTGPRREGTGPRREGTGPRRDGDAPRSRAPRRDDGRATRRDDGAAGRPPRERSERKPYGERSERKPYGERSDRKPYGERSGRPSGPRTSSPRREGSGPRRDNNRGSRRDDRPVRDEIVERPLTAAEKKAREVRARTGGRRTQGHGEPTTPPKRERVEWIDEGSVRGTARSAARRAAGGDGAPARIQGIPRSDRPLPGTVAREVERGVGARQSKSASERLQKAIDAFERERYGEASKLLAALSRQLPSMALVHELAGLSAYRQSKWRMVINELETVRVLDASRTSVLPVLADAYRAVKRWAKVNDLWEELKGLSPHPAILAEGRIVTAGALSDQGKMAEAIEMFKSVLSVPKRVQEYHLREWYVAADLNDRVGNVADARRLFDRIMKYDREFADVVDRARQLGSPR